MCERKLGCRLCSAWHLGSIQQHGMATRIIRDMRANFCISRARKLVFACVSIIGSGEYVHTRVPNRSIWMVLGWSCEALIRVPRQKCWRRAYASCSKTQRYARVFTWWLHPLFVFDFDSFNSKTVQVESEYCSRVQRKRRLCINPHMYEPFARGRNKSDGCAALRTGKPAI